MSDETTTTEAESQDTPVDEAAAASLGDPGKRAIDAMKQQRNAAREERDRLQSQLDQMKQAQMSDLEKAQAQARSFEEAATKAQAEALRWRIAARHGISDEDAETFLTGIDEASLTKQAERLAAMAVKEPTTPKPDASQGGSGAPALNSDALESALKSKLGIA